jgi:hypothetical protein
MAAGNQKALDLQRQLDASRSEERRQIGLHLRMLFVDRNSAMIDLVNETAAKGVAIPEDENPIYFLEESNYVGGVQKAWLEREIQPALSAVLDAGAMWMDVGETLFNQRIVHGDRSELGNPEGIQPARAEQHQAQLEADLGAQRWAVVETQANRIREALRAVTEDAYEAGLFTDETAEMMRDNAYYAPFQVVEYMDTHLNWQVLKQKGTLKSVNNPADALVLKALSTIRATERNRMVSSVVRFLERHHPGEIENAATRWDGKRHVPVEPKDRTKALILYYEGGKQRGKYVDTYIAQAVNHTSIGHNKAVMAVLNVLTLAPIFRPLFTTYNPGFHIWNLQRDFRRFWKNAPGMTLGKAVVLYAKALPPAYVRAGKPGLSAINKVLASLNLQIDIIDAEGRVRDAEAAKVFSISYGDLMTGREIADSHLEEVLAKHGVQGTAQGPPRHPAIVPFAKFLNTLKAIGDLAETLPKMAAIEHFSPTGKADALTPMQRSFIRRMVGSPDFLAGGTATAATNKVFIYSNAAIQGQRSDWQMLRRHGAEQMPQMASGERRASAVLWKTAAIDLLPKVLMYAILMGLFGDWLRRIWERGSSEYDRTNYTVIPLGEDGPNGVIARIPSDFAGQFLGGLFWKLLNLAGGDASVMDTISQVADYTGGQLPSTTPAFGLAKSTYQMATGRNPYDEYRGRTVLTMQEQIERGWPAWRKFLGWQFQQVGGGIVWKFYPGERPREKTDLQTYLDLPVLSNIVGRTIKSSAYGEIEALRRTQQDVQQQEAQTSGAKRRAVDQAVTSYLGLSPAQQTPGMQEALAIEVVRQVYADAPNEVKNTQYRDVLKRIRMGIARGEGDPVVDAVLSATSNRQKVALLLRARTTMGDQAFFDWMRRAADAGVVSEAVQEEVAAQLMKEATAAR